MEKASWCRLVEREYLGADAEFVEGVLPLGSVDASSFGLIADATRYVLTEEGGEVHIRPDISSLDEILRSLAQGGAVVSPKDARAAVQRFAELWEERVRAQGKWEEVVRLARERGEISGPPGRPKRGWSFRR